MLNHITERKFRYNYKLKDGTIWRHDFRILGECIAQMNKGFSPIVLICGKQRVGKSFFAIWLAYKILHYFKPDLKFNTDRNVFYDPAKSIDAINRLSLEPIIIDEAGSLHNRHEWYAKVNIVFDKVLQTQGYKSNMYIFISPFGGDLVKGLRKHVDFLVYLRKRGIAIVKKIPKRYDELSDIIPRPYRVEQIKIELNSVPTEVWKEYERYSFKIKEELNKKFLEEILQSQNKMKRDPFGRMLNA